MLKIFLAALLFLSLPAHASLKPLEAVNLQPQDATFSIYASKNTTIALEINNEEPGHDVDIFPEPSLRVTNTVIGKSCTIDGGIWVKGQIYLVADEQLLITYQYSGSNDDLVINRTDTCAEVTRLSVTNQYMPATSDGLSISHLCKDKRLKSCKKVKKITFASLLKEK